MLEKKAPKKIKIELFRDGSQWCALVGPTLQVGLSGFGDSPAEAVNDLLDQREGEFNGYVKGAAFHA